MTSHILHLLDRAESLPGFQNIIITRGQVRLVCQHNTWTIPFHLLDFWLYQGADIAAIIAAVQPPVLRSLGEGGSTVPLTPNPSNP